MDVLAIERMCVEYLACVNMDGISKYKKNRCWGA